MRTGPALRGITSRHGTFFRSEAVELGVDDRTLTREVRAGRLVRVRHGTYAFADEWAALDAVERHVVLTRGALRCLGDVVAASHHSAAALHGLDLWQVPLGLTHVTRLDGGAGRTESGIAHHEGFCLDTDLVAVDGGRAVVPVRAALESASLVDVERGLVTVSSGLRLQLFSSEDLVRQHELMRAWPDTRHLHLVTRLADGRLGSAGEARCLYLFWSQRLPMPELQFEVYDGERLVGVADFAWPARGVLGEFDGRVKYGRHLRPGEQPGDAVFREKRREDLLRRLTGWRFVRLTWVDLADPVRTATMLRAELDRAA